VSRPVRLLELVDLLASRRPRSISEIASHLEVSQRTVYRDIAELEQERHLPVVRDEDGYRLLETATLRPLNLTAAESAVLRLALDNPAIARQAHLAPTLRRLRAKLDAATAAGEGRAAPRTTRLAGADRTGASAQRVFGPLEDAVAERFEIELDYASLSGGTRRWRGVDPYCIFRREGTWYLAGRCHLRDEPRSFRLDRIAGVRRLGPRFEPPDGFDLGRYLDGAWGIFRGDGAHDVELRFSPKLAALVENARHHDGESWERLPDGSIGYRVRLTHLEEVARWIVGFGGDCRAVAPEELRERVREIAAGVVRSQSGR